MFPLIRYSFLTPSYFGDCRWAQEPAVNLEVEGESQHPQTNMFKRVGAKNDWIKYSIASCCIFGTNNYFIGELGSKYGVAALWPFSLGYILCWLTYHASTKSTSFYRNNAQAKLGVFVRGVVHITLLVMTVMAFRYADLANVNQGVIAGLFTSGVAFSSLFFWLIWGEEISKVTVLGMVMICAGVVCVGLKESDSASEDTEDVEWANLIIAITYAIATGLGYSINSVLMRYYV